MVKKNYTKTSPEVVELRKKILKCAKKCIRTPADFNFLAGLIAGKTDETLSTTTLKRLYGYIDGADIIRPSTLNILAKYVGYENWEDYISKFEKEGSDLEDLITDKCFSLSNIGIGKKLSLQGRSNKKIVVEYIGDNRWEVVEAENTKIVVGEIFKCGFFLLQEPSLTEESAKTQAETINIVIKSV